MNLIRKMLTHVIQHEYSTFKIRVTRHGQRGRTIYIRHCRQEARELARKYRHKGRHVVMFEMLPDGEWQRIEG